MINKKNHNTDDPSNNLGKRATIQKPKDQTSF